MLSYNDLANLLRAAAFQSRLYPYREEELVDVNEFTREYCMFAVPHDWEPPFEFHATLSFHWDVVYSAYANYGTAGLCALYHSEDQECPHDTLYQADPFIEVEIEYRLPETIVVSLADSEAHLAFAGHVQDLIRQVVTHDNLPALSIRTIFTGEKQHLEEVSARHFWTFEADDLEDAAGLADSFVSICEEVHAVLHQLDKEFRPKSPKKRRRPRGNGRP